MELDPGLSFGTGQHPTTLFCLRQLVARRQRGKAQSFLDLGTGSGILAIAAAKLGYAPIEAVDIDAEAIRIARTNACANRVAALIHFRQEGVGKRGGKGHYNVVCANLTADVLREQRKWILAQLAHPGMLVLAGILEREFPEVRSSYEAAGLRLLTSRREREWHSGAFV